MLDTPCSEVVRSVLAIHSIRQFPLHFASRVSPCAITFQLESNIHHRTGHESPEGKQTYSSTISWTSALDEGGWSTPRPGRFTPGKDPVPIVQEVGWAPGPVWTVAKISPPPGFDPPTYPARSESLYRLRYPGPLGNTYSTCTYYLVVIPIYIGAKQMHKVSACTQYYSILVCGAVAEIIKVWATWGALGWFGGWAQCGA